MDLYEALKSGTSENELQKSFDEELAKARMRIAAEEKKKKEEENLKKAKQQQVDSCRETLAESILDYADSLFGSDITIYSIEDIEKELKNFEKEVNNLTDLFFVLNDLLKKADTEKIPSLKVKKINSKSDDDIIQAFLDSLIH